jgi:hypothetical protein
MDKINKDLISKETKLTKIQDELKSLETSKKIKRASFTWALFI